MPTGELIVAVSIQDDPVLTHLIKDLERLCNSPELSAEWQFSKVELETFPTLENLAGRLNDFFEIPQRFAIVVSDRLVREREFAQDAKELIDPNFHHPLVTLAVTGDGRRVPDIDRVVRTTVERDELAEELKLLAARLRYMGPPHKQDFPNPFRVRRIRDEFELSRYYRLRHEVYTIMGYMSAKKEQVATKLEIDGCDVNAIHLGAFELCEGYQELVGTARVLLSEAEETTWANWTRSLLKSDRPLRVLVKNETLPLGLPVFHSQQLNDQLQESFEQELLCAELSRVIVADEYRGMGLARELVSTAIREAQQAGVDRLYLECLRLHESLYAKFGFRKIPGKSGNVIGVNKSMIAMVMELSEIHADEESLADHRPSLPD